MVQTVQRPPVVATPPFPVIPGAMTLTDLNRYGVRVRPPTVTQYRGYILYSMGLPSSGGITTGAILKMLEGFDLSQGNRAKAWHTVIEAERLAFADRNAYLGDPEFVDVPLTGLQSPGFTQTRRAQVGDRPPQARDFRATAGDPLPFQQDPSPSLTSLPAIAQRDEQSGLSTTHLVTSDRWGNLVSYTCTLESTGGSAMVVPGYGFILNNQLTDFDPVSPHPNAPEPYKRPRSSMAPTIMRSPEGPWWPWAPPAAPPLLPRWPVLPLI
jgi:gamma-glutamyltranspeptidase/glutathione hydrolase